MAIRFNADELLSIAEQIERNGTAFYAAAAKAVSAPDAVQLLNELSSWEHTHLETFAAMRGALSPAERESDTYDPDHELAAYLQATADSVIFVAGQDPLAALGACPTLEAILQAALAREKDSIVFYTGMRDYVPPRLGRERVEAIIREEMGHVAMLHRQLASPVG